MKFVESVLARVASLDSKTRKRLIAVAITAVVLVVGLASLEPATSVASPVHRSATTAKPNLIQTANLFVHVTGAVRHPGVYQLPAGSRVFDAVFAAGGLAKHADDASVNLARELSDGEQLIILKVGNELATVGSVGSGASAGGRVNINRATVAELDTLPGIGPTLAQRILDYRAANGGFRSIDDLDAVAGIGQALMSRLRDVVTL